MSKAIRRRAHISDGILQKTFPFFQHVGWQTASGQYAPEACDEVPSQPASLTPFQQIRFPAELFADLTKREMQNMLEILHYALKAKTGDDAYHVLQLIQDMVACPRVIGGGATLNSQGRFQQFVSVINVSYSTDWLYTYCKRNYADADPVLQSVLSTFHTQVWEQTYKATSFPKQLEFVEEARSYGLTHGLTTGRLEPGRGLASFFSFAGGDLDNTVRHKGLLEYLLPLLHRIMVTNVPAPSANHTIKGLSHRELTVLEWMKQGKTNWEISRIIGVSERTVRFHVESIFTKLNVGSRTQAVACAMEQGLLPNI